MIDVRVGFPLDAFSIYPWKEKGRMKGVIYGRPYSFTILFGRNANRPNMNESLTCYLQFMTLQPNVFFPLPQVEAIKLHPGSMQYSYSKVYTSISGLRFSSSGVTQSYGSNPNPNYYSLSRLCDGNLKNAYIVTSSYTNVVITVSLPRNMFIHHIRIYPVCSTFKLFAGLGRSVLGKTLPSVLSRALGSDLECYSRSRAQFGPIRTH